MRVHLQDSPPPPTPQYPVLGWIQTSDDLAKAYRRTVPTPITRLEFDYCFDNELFFNKFVLENFVFGFAMSGYWGVPTRFFANQALPNGGTVTVVVGVNGAELILCIVRSSNVTGKIRKVRVNDQAIDLQPLSASLAEMDVLLSPTNTQLVNQITKPATDLTPITTRVSALESKQPSTVVPPTITPTNIQAAAQVPIPTAPVTQPIATGNLASSTWVTTPHTDGMSGAIQGASIYWRIVWTDTGYVFTCQGVGDVGNPWMVVERVGVGTTSRATTATLAAQTITRTFAGYTLDVKIPGGGKTFTVTRPRANLDIGWTVTQDTRLGLPVFLYMKANATVKVVWGRSTVYLLLDGESGNWLINHWLVTDTQTNQVPAVTNGTVTLVECSGADRVKVTTPGNATFTCYRPSAGQTWAAVEQPLCDRSQAIWDYTDITLGAFCSREWRKPNGHYITLRYSPSTQIEVYSPGLTFDWYRLTRPDGSQVTAKDGTVPAQYNEIFSLVEIWVGSSGSVSLPTGAPTIVAPIAVLPTLMGVPGQWAEYLAWFQVADTPLGKAVTSLRSQMSGLVQKIAATQFDTGVEWDTGFLRGGKKVYTQCYTGTLPNNANDNLLFTITGATQVLNYEGYYKQPTSSRSSILGISSGSSGHGPIFQFYTNEAHWYNVTGDVRWQSGTYWMRVWYVK